MNRFPVPTDPEQRSWPESPDPDLCVLCENCIAVCDEMGPSALTLDDREAPGKISAAFGDAAGECIGCGSCSLCCPTSAIPMEDSSTTRNIWGHAFTLARCQKCGRPTLAEEHIDFVSARYGLARSYFEQCDECRRRETADRFTSVMEG